MTRDYLGSTREDLSNTFFFFLKRGVSHTFLTNLTVIELQFKILPLPTIYMTRSCDVIRDMIASFLFVLGNVLI